MRQPMLKQVTASNDKVGMLVLNSNNNTSKGMLIAVATFSIVKKVQGLVVGIRSVIMAQKHRVEAVIAPRVVVPLRVVVITVLIPPVVAEVEQRRRGTQLDVARQ